LRKISEGGKNAAPTENRRGVASHATVFYGDPMHRWRAAKMPPLQKTGVGSHRIRPFFMAILCIAGGRQECRPYRKPAWGRIACDRFLWRSYASLAGGKNAAPTAGR